MSTNQNNFIAETSSTLLPRSHPLTSSWKAPITLEIAQQLLLPSSSPLLWGTEQEAIRAHSWEARTGVLLSCWARFITTGSDTIQGPCPFLTEQYNSLEAHPCTGFSSQMILRSHEPHAPALSDCLHRQVPLLALWSLGTYPIPRHSSPSDSFPSRQFISSPSPLSYLRPGSEVFILLCEVASCISPEELQTRHSAGRPARRVGPGSQA